MKKTLLTITFISLTASGFAQIYTKKNENNQDTVQVDKQVLGKNEININLLMLGLTGAAEIGYERLFESSGIGISASADMANMRYNFSVVSYYRVYFGKKKASGFFVEGNAVFWNSEKSSWGKYNEDGTYVELGRLIENQFGFGAAVGSKFLNKNGFVGELFGGVAKLFLGGASDDYFPRVGMTIGKRF